MSGHPTGVDYAGTEANDRLAAKDGEIARLRAALAKAEGERDEARRLAQDAQANVSALEMLSVRRWDAAEARASALEQERADEWRRRRDAQGSRDVAKAAADELRDRASVLEALLTEAAQILDEAQCCIDAEDQVEVFQRITAILPRLRAGKDADHG